MSTHIVSAGLLTPLPPIEHMGINHCCLNVLMPKEFLNSPDVISGFQQVCDERMPQRVTRCVFDNAGFSGSSASVAILRDSVPKRRLKWPVAV